MRASHRKAPQLNTQSAQGVVRDTVLSYLDTSEPLPLRAAVIRDTSRELPWGTGPISPVTRTALMATVCINCLYRDGTVTERGELRGSRSCDYGAFYWVQRWTNDCGHIDAYDDIAVEDTAIRGALAPGVWTAPAADGRMPAELTTDQLAQTVHGTDQNRTVRGAVATLAFTGRTARFAAADGTEVVYTWTRQEAPDAGQ